MKVISLSLIRNSMYNFSSSVIPGLCAVIAIGYLSRSLESAEFGLLFLMYAVVGYSGILDLGVSKAVTRSIAHERDRKNLSQVMGTALTFSSMIGLIFVTIILLLYLLLADGLIEDGTYAREDVSLLIWASALCLFALLPHLILVGYFEGVENFVKSNVIRTFAGSVLYIGPMMGYYFFESFTAVVIGVCVGRYLALSVSLLLFTRSLAAKRMTFSLQKLKALLNFGSWLAVTNVISPLMVYLDRFLIVKFVGPGPFAAYASSAELVQRFSIFPTAITRALFPRLVRLAGQQGTSHDARLSYIMVIISSGLPALVLCLFSGPIMRLWLGDDIGSLAGAVLPILALGFFCNSIALIPYNSIQAKGHSKLTAIIHILEVLPYLGLLLYSVEQYGITGAASAWSLRMLVDMIIMLSANSRLHMRVNT